VYESYSHWSELAFEMLLLLPQYMPARVFFSSSSHQNVGTKSKDSRVW